MSEFNIYDGIEGQEGEKWYLERILDAVKNDSVEDVLAALHHA